MSASSLVIRTVGAIAFGLAAFVASSPASAQSTDEITVSISRLQALDKADALSKADFFAKVTIAGETFTTPVIKQKDWSRPGWKVSKKVPKGSHDVKIALFDKDATKDDPIDINRVGNKRDIDFKVNTASCQIEGFSSGYSCGDNITRAGAEKKKAEITFKVDVKR